MSRVPPYVHRPRHALVHRSGTESSGVVAAVACVAVALLLYLIAARVLGVDDDAVDGPFGATGTPRDAAIV